MVITALILTVLIGMVALVIDIGFAAGQRRFMQNGADAAALAAADLFSGSVSPYPVAGPWPQGIPNFFNVTDDLVRDKATEIATKNQNPGIKGRTTSFSVTVEYCVAADNNSYAPQTAGCPSPNSWVASPTANGRVPDGAYKVRVTVNSTISTFFGGVIGKSSTNSVGQGIAVILGVCPQLSATGTSCRSRCGISKISEPIPTNSSNSGARILPRHTTPTALGRTCSISAPSTVWCDGRTSDYDWVADPTYAGMVPQGTNCTPNLSDSTKNFTGSSTRLES